MLENRSAASALSIMNQLPLARQAYVGMELGVAFAVG